jgi:hypothetical protein
VGLSGRALLLSVTGIVVSPPGEFHKLFVQHTHGFTSLFACCAAIQLSPTLPTSIVRGKSAKTWAFVSSEDDRKRSVPIDEAKFDDYRTIEDPVSRKRNDLTRSYHQKCQTFTNRSFGLTGTTG